MTAPETATEPETVSEPDAVTVAETVSEPETVSETDVGTEPDAGADIADTVDVSQGPPVALVITEVFARPCMSDEADGEWVEIRNVDSRAARLDGWTLRDADNDRHVIAPAAPLELAPGALFVFGATTEQNRNGAAPVGYAWGDDIRLANTSDEFWLVSPGGVVVDRVAWGGDGPSVSECQALSLDPARSTAEDNDLAESWCPAEGSFGWGDEGSPGGVNPSCADR